MVTRTDLTRAHKSSQTSLSRATIREVDDDHYWQEATADVMASETHSGFERCQQYGFTCVPMKQSEEEGGKQQGQQGQQSGGAGGGAGTPGKQGKQPKGDAAEAVIAYMNGSRSHPIAIGIDDRRFRMMNAKVGDVALYDHQQQQLHFNKDGAYLTSLPDKTIKLQLADKGDPGEPKKQEGQASGQQDQQKKKFGQKPRYEKESETYVNMTKDAVHTVRGNGNVKATDASTTTYHSDENKQSTKCDAGHTHIRGAGDKIWVEPGACLATKPIEIADCGCGGGKKSYGVGGDASTPPSAGAALLSLAPSLLTSEQNAQAPSRMRFWIVRHLNSFGVENCHVEDVDFTALAAGVEIVEWKEGMGEIEYDDRPRLRETITDATPFVPFFDQFIAKLPNITLVQAKKIKCDLISLLYDNKRQLAYHYVVAAGDYSWDATDDVVAAMSTVAIPSLISAVAGISDTATINKINNVVDQVNTKVVNPGNTLSTQINSSGGSLANQINSVGGDFAANINSQVNTHVVSDGNYGFYQINTSFVSINGQLDYIKSNFVLCSDNLQSSGGVATPGLPGVLYDIANVPVPAASYITNIATAYGSVSYPGVTGNPFTSVTQQSAGVGPVQIPSMQWTPIDNAAPVTLSASEMAGLMSGIATRRSNLLNARITKKNAVNALTDIAAVIAYDVTTGWPS
jgi:phage gp45-like